MTLDTRARTRTPLPWRVVGGTAIAWVLANVAVVVLAHGHLPFHRPGLHGASYGSQLLAPNLAMLEVLVLIGVTYALTRRRTVPDLAARAPERAVARRETVWLVLYGIGGLLGGLLLARALGYHPISFHLTGTLYGTTDVVTPAEVAVWAAYNFAVYAVGPYLWFRRRYTAEQLGLRSSDRRNDLLVIVVVLALEIVAELAGFSSAIFALSPRQLALGMPLAFVVYFVGTVLPTMVFIQCVLVPRFRKLTGSTAATVLLGGVTYTLLHCYDGWLSVDTVSATVLSLIFLFFQYLGPGMIKTVLTLRTGNAWVHVWAYHAIAPHVVGDTPTIVKIFHV
jgi:xanthosine utilization system XapX-like protein